MRRAFFLLCLAMGSLVSLPAAADLDDCEKAFGINDFVAAMNQVDTAVGSFELENARNILDAAERGLFCMPDAVHPNHLTRFARLKALLAFFDQDELTAQRWGTLAKVAGAAPWPEGMDETHPFREMVEGSPMPPQGGPEGAGLYPPKDGAFLMNGRFLAEPKAWAEVPNFLQVYDKHGLVVESFWQDGANFPSRFLAADPTPATPPSWYSPPSDALDPMAKVEVDPAVIARRQEAAQEKAREKAEAEARQKEMEAALSARAARESALADKLAAKHKKKQEKLAEREARKLARTGAIVQRDPDAPPPPPDEWVDFSVDDANIEDFSKLDMASIDIRCNDYLKLEPAALMGKLSMDQIKCLEVSIRYSHKQTERDRISRILMADAWAKELPHRWEAAVRRHLTDIDRSDADLCYIFARYLAKQEESSQEAIRWAEIAMVRAPAKWNGDVRVERVNELLRIKALAAQTEWLRLEQKFLYDKSRELQVRANNWRARTKIAAREWLEYAFNAKKDWQIAKDLCISASGTRSYCDVDEVAKRGD